MTVETVETREKTFPPTRSVHNYSFNDIFIHSTKPALFHFQVPPRMLTYRFFVRFTDDEFYCVAEKTREVEKKIYSFLYKQIFFPVKYLYERKSTR